MDQIFPAAIDMIQSSVAANNSWSAAQAQKQMDFQEHMSNTAHQREVADLKAAGLNPVLSARLGGASTPSGSAASADTSGTSGLAQLLVELMQQTAEASAAGAASGSARSYLAAMSDGPAVFDISGVPLTGRDLQSYNTTPSKSFQKNVNQAIYAVSPGASKLLKLAPNPWSAALGGVLDKVFTNKSMKDAARTGNYVYTPSGRVAIKNTDGTYTIATPRQERYFKK